ncbi:hypothetical protein QO004_005051 [Rhizobium mesoamericanum]|nr:hypothetical protein [Rhizobium mesoamericanum]
MPERIATKGLFVGWLEQSHKIINVFNIPIPVPHRPTLWAP